MRKKVWAGAISGMLLLGLLAGCGGGAKTAENGAEPNGQAAGEEAEGTDKVNLRLIRTVLKKPTTGTRRCRPTKKRTRA